ncbi:hypothetical protein C8R42DRAFT_414369 [Lentinula raphanica]|nr:hypothetical protein C8R42DRAFT_414369 [Lentinula raphanica]
MFYIVLRKSLKIMYRKFLLRCWWQYNDQSASHGSDIDNRNAFYVLKPARRPSLDYSQKSQDVLDKPDSIFPVP